MWAKIIIFISFPSCSHSLCLGMFQWDDYISHNTEVTTTLTVLIDRLFSNPRFDISHQGKNVYIQTVKDSPRLVSELALVHSMYDTWWWWWHHVVWRRQTAHQNALDDEYKVPVAQFHSYKQSYQLIQNLKQKKTCSKFYHSDSDISLHSFGTMQQTFSLAHSSSSSHTPSPVVQCPQSLTNKSHSRVFQYSRAKNLHGLPQVSWSREALFCKHLWGWTPLFNTYCYIFHSKFKSVMATSYMEKNVY